jgi:hypothetical protein
MHNKIGVPAQCGEQRQCQLHVKGSQHRALAACALPGGGGCTWHRAQRQTAPAHAHTRQGNMGRLGRRGTWVCRVGLHLVHMLTANGSEAGSGKGGSRRLQRRGGNVEGTARVRVLSSHTCPERHGGEALQQRPRAMGVRQAPSDRGTVDRGNQKGRGWTGVVVSTRLFG